jgi:predicted permease
MGRTLLEGDERGGAEEVVVVGYDFWKYKLDGAADAVGRVIRISGTPVTIVGVMPRGYGFPQRNEVWRPLHLERLPEASPSLRYVFGRLAPGRSRQEAAAQAAAIGARAATIFPETHENVRLQVVSLPDAVSDLPEAAALVLASINVFLVLLTALLCGNVAMLLFARAVSRERELLVRTALGASRGRLVMQLFAEALLLCAVGAVVGLLVARFVLARTWMMIEEQSGPLPFWIDPSISPPTLLYAAGLTLFAATIAGVVPALKVVSGSTGGRLRAASSGGGGLQFGGVWTVVIVAQIALTTMLPVPLLGVGGDFGRKTPAGFPAEAFLTATLEMDRFDGAAASGDTVPAVRAARLGERYRALADRLRQDPRVLDVTYADQMPVMRHRWTGIIMDPGPAAEHSERCVGGYCAASVSVDPRFFEVIGAPVIRGRALATADAEHQTRAVLVNELFVDQVMGGRNPIGRRLRFFSSGREPTAESWHEIVGVVPDLGVSDNHSDFGRARVFQATLPRATGPLLVAIHLRGDPQGFAVRLRELAQAVDPALRVIDPKPLPRLAETASAFWIALLVGFTGVTLMLSLAGVYAVTAFSVARRTREIGVRVALGARPLQVLATVFKRPLVQIALGIGVGAVLGLGLANNDLSDVHLDDFGMMAVFVLSTILCCALACIVPTRRALRIQPSEALKDEG